MNAERDVFRHPALKKNDTRPLRSETFVAANIPGRIEISVTPARGPGRLRSLAGLEMP
jgi:hypothetical protein